MTDSVCAGIEGQHDERGDPADLSGLLLSELAEEVFAQGRVPEPHAGPGEIRIRVAAARINPVDWKLRSGEVRAHFPVDFPAIPGRDAAGVVDEVGEGVTGVAVGDRDFGLGGIFRATAQYATLTAWAPVPEPWMLEQAAGAGLAVATVGRGLNALGDLFGGTLLIEGAASGVGSAAVAMTVARGATVIGTLSTGKHAYLRTLGPCPPPTAKGWPIESANSFRWEWMPCSTWLPPARSPILSPSPVTRTAS